VIRLPCRRPGLTAGWAYELAMICPRSADVQCEAMTKRRRSARPEMRIAANSSLIVILARQKTKLTSKPAKATQGPFARSIRGIPHNPVGPEYGDWDWYCF
jgi:hypothetical protein